MYEAPASAKSWTMRSTGDTMRCTSMGAVTPCLRSALRGMASTRAEAVKVCPRSFGYEHTSGPIVRFGT